MSSLPLQFLLLTLAGWMTRDQHRVTEYLLAENAVLRQQLGGRRIRTRTRCGAGSQPLPRSSGAKRSRSSTRW
jgi:hypothetical protein